MKNFEFYDRGGDRPWINPLLTNAAIVGHTTTITAKLWMRAYQENDYRMVVSPTPILNEQEAYVDWMPGTQTQNGKEVFVLKSAKGDEIRILDYASLSSPAKLKYDNDLTSVWELTGLQPNQRYYYAGFAVNVDERKTAWEVPPDSQYHRFRTQGEKQESVTFGLFSCHMPYKKDSFDLVNIHMWDRFGDELEDRNADFVLGVGDQVYVDGHPNVSIWAWLKKNRKEFVKVVAPKERVKAMRSWYRDIYRGYWGHRPLRRVFSRFPQYMIWDDHEILDGWGSYDKKEMQNLLDSWWDWGSDEEKIELTNQMYEAAKETYREYEHSHNPSTPEGQYDYSFDWSGAAFYVLDMRGQRDYNRTKTNDRVLGAAQMQRFKDWLTSDTVKRAAAIFVVSPVPVVHANSFVVNHLDILGMADDMRDEWERASNWVERDVLLDAAFGAAKAGAKALFFLSGDVHIGAAFKLTHKNYPDAKVYQLTSSAITYDLPWLNATALTLIIKRHGTLQRDAVGLPNVAFELLSEPCKTNNFAVVKMHAKENGQGNQVEVLWDLYGTAEYGTAVTKLERLTLG